MDLMSIAKPLVVKTQQLVEKVVVRPVPRPKWYRNKCKTRPKRCESGTLSPRMELGGNIEEFFNRLWTLAIQAA
jgi:hypothetical protein